MSKRSTKARISREFYNFRKMESDRISKVMNGLRIPEVEIDRLIARKLSRGSIDIFEDIDKRR